MQIHKQNTYITVSSGVQLSGDTITPQVLKNRRNVVGYILDCLSLRLDCDYFEFKELDAYSDLNAMLSDENFWIKFKIKPIMYFNGFGLFLLAKTDIQYKYSVIQNSPDYIDKTMNDA